MRSMKATKYESRLLRPVLGSAVLLLGVGVWQCGSRAAPIPKIATSAMPSPNSYDFYVKAEKANADLSHSIAGGPDVDPVYDSSAARGLSPQQLAHRYPLAAKDAWIKKNATALHLLRQGFTYQYRQPPVRSSSASFTYLIQFRYLARLLVVESHTKSERGDWAGASRSTLDILHLGNDIPRGGPLLSSLVSYAINAIGIKEFRNVLPHLDAAASRAAATQIEKLEANRFTYAEMMEEEKKTTWATLQEILNKPDWRSGFIAYVAKGGAVDHNLRARLESLDKQTVINGYTRCMDALIAEAKRPYASRHLPPIPSDPVNQYMLTLFTQPAWLSARDEASREFLEIDLALRAFKLEHGIFPKTLQALRPKYIRRIPRDAYGRGEALHYRKTEKSYVLYSIGPDGKDDGGKAIDDGERLVSSNPNARYFMLSTSKGDYVAGINR